ncbi:gremlin-2-like [Daphnia carinata]|uniref:gremlin-2-like n=1 Tax=Daphnia carinata TaxID=120202 RepID=UPI002579A591|nr:gremlin-2-like [Daphnia carinata]
MVRIVILVVSLLVVCGFDPVAGFRHRRHQHHRDGSRRTDHGTSAILASDEEKLNATKTLRNILQTSPKDALIVTKRRYLRKDWCQSQPLIQRIGQDQCLSVTILNRFCYGQCNSFFIPKNQLKEEDSPDEETQEGQESAAGGAISGAGIAGTAKAFRSCAVCQPKKTSWVTVTLKCPSLVPNIRRRRVLVINQCRCMQPESTSSSS